MRTHFIALASLTGLATLSVAPAVHAEAAEATAVVRAKADAAVVSTNQTASAPRPSARRFYADGYGFGTFTSPAFSRGYYSSPRGVVFLLDIPENDNRRLLNPPPANLDDVQSFRRSASSRASQAPDPDQLIFVRTREPLPPIAISPWERIDERYIDALRRDRPWIRRTDTILEDLRQAQATWLRENGFTDAVVTTQGNPAPARERAATPASSAPSGPSELHVAVGQDAAERVPSAAEKLDRSTVIRVRAAEREGDR